VRAVPTQNHPGVGLNLFSQVSLGYPSCNYSFIGQMKVKSFKKGSAGIFGVNYKISFHCANNEKYSRNCATGAEKEAIL
jgi:hypothetical protein